jgi:hypothetical protein
MPMPRKKRTKPIAPVDDGKQFSLEDFAEKEPTKIVLKLAKPKIVLKESKPPKIVLKEIKPES